MVDRAEQPAPTPHLAELSTQALATAWVDASAAICGDLDLERTAREQTVVELLEGVKPSAEYHGEEPEPTKPEDIARLNEVAKEIGWRIIQNRLPGTVKPTEGTE